MPGARTNRAASSRFPGWLTCPPAGA